uniref:Uncharacterized protein n=1 Tax=Magallana gigas TaxID=29159 RepID=K1PBX3_MAGGI
MRLGLSVAMLAGIRSTQWKVHGSCAESVPGVQNISQYFTKAVKLAEMYNIKEILRSRNVTEGKSYTISSIQDAMKRNTTRLSKITWSKSKCASYCRDQRDAADIILQYTTNVISKLSDQKYLFVSY